MKLRLLLLTLTGLTFLWGCQQSEDDSQSNYIELRGQTMGTTYQVVYEDPEGNEWIRPVDSLLVAVNNSMSTYIPNSLISILNNQDSVFTLTVDHHFYRVFSMAKQMHQQSNGAMNPAVMPLIRYWGFGPDEKPDVIDSTVVDSLRTHTDFQNFTGAMLIVPESGKEDTVYRINKKDAYAMLDFSAIAKGYGVDVLAEWLEWKGYENYFVEIGGEIRAKGLDKTEKPWLVGLEDPVTSKVENRQAVTYIHLSKGAVATSGNYRNVREIDGKRYSHTFNPATGYPELNDLLSASIYAPTCMEADGFATACMVLGFAQARELVESADSLEAYLIYTNAEGETQHWFSPGMEEMIVEP